VAVVTVSLAAHRFPPRPGATYEERLARSREMLSHALSQGSTVAVVGSGCSAPLGYPNWRQLATEIVDLSLEAVRAGVRDTTAEGTLERLLGFRQRLEPPARVGSDELTFFIGVCKRVLEDTPAGRGRIGQYLGQRFAPRQRAPSGVPHSPHRALLGLPIRRFVTTNYDCELERALAEVRRVPWEEFGIPEGNGRSRLAGPPRSFSQRPENCDQQALFALARVAAAENLVFHCHGRYDDPGSIIATELDYQQWYLREQEGGTPAFVRTFDLLFSSNPLLFVGYGLGDEDLLRPLRRIGALSPERREYRLLFALLPEASAGAERDRHERLFERYGLNVLPFPRPATDDPEEWGRVLCAELVRLEEDRGRWKDGWLEKPAIRPVAVRAKPPRPYRHYSVEAGGEEVLGERRLTGEVHSLRELALGKEARVIGLVGPGGTGKSWLAMRLLQDLEGNAGEFRGLFFWSSYYADDVVTGIDRLLAYIDPLGSRDQSRLTRLRSCLDQTRDRYLIVLDGFERLLHPTDDPGQGESNDPLVRTLLEIFSGPHNRSTLILTSRLWPRDLDPRDPAIHEFPVPRMRTDDLLPVIPFAWFERDQVSALCSLLGGHAYALLLAARFLRHRGPQEASERLSKLRRELSGSPPDRRLASMIRLAIDTLEAETQGLARPLLQRLAVFMSPISDQTVGICFALAEESRTTPDATVVSAPEVLETLRSAHLVFEVRSGRSELEPRAYSVHPTVRSYIFQPARQIERDVLPNFTLAGFTSGKAAVHPGSPETATMVRALFDRLHRRALDELASGRHEAARQFCRSLFGILRSRMETNTAPRWCAYHDYIRFGLRVADLARRLSPRCWSFREPHELPRIEDPAAPLYADELAFVYNDIGLTLCAEGYMHDTLAVWQQGYEINQILEGTAEVPFYTLQSQLHLGHTFLELGDLRLAHQYLEETAVTNHRVKDPDYGARIVGYQALVAYYRTHYEDAERWFAKALRELRAAGGNPRAESFFLSHWAKLAMVLGLFDRAGRFVRSCRALAEAGGADDLVAYARTAHGRLLREMEEFRQANAEYHAALVVARRLGIRRLEAEILCGLSRLALQLGDAELARRHAMAALAIANELSLGLRQTQSLLLLGQATVRAGQASLGIAYLMLAKERADDQEYRLRSREAEETLQKLGESVGDD
jgi:tetratricopeptide (TPR) repeat protein